MTASGADPEVSGPPATRSAVLGAAEDVARPAAMGWRLDPVSPGSLYGRWILVCAAAELLGIAAGALWWVAMDRLSPDPVATGEKLLMLCLKALAGLPEGIVLASLQAAALRRRYPLLPVRLWVVLTVAVAVLGWAAGSAVPIFGSASQGAELGEPPLALVLLFASGLGVTVGAVFGAAQALALRRAATPSAWWILANAAGWAIALPVVYAGAGLFDSAPSAAAIVSAGLAAGSAAGLLLGAVTGLAFWRMEPTRFALGQSA